MVALSVALKEGTYEMNKSALIDAVAVEALVQKFWAQ